MALAPRPEMDPLESVRIRQFGGMLRGTAQGQEAPFTRLTQNLEPVDPMQVGFGPAPAIRPARGTTTKLTFTPESNRSLNAIIVSDVPDKADAFLVSFATADLVTLGTGSEPAGAVSGMGVFAPDNVNDFAATTLSDS